MYISDKIKSIRLNLRNIFNSSALLKRSFIHNTKEFFNNSTLHGVKYIAEDGIPSIEKFIWFCFTSIGTIIAFIIIMSLWEKFQTNPIITGLDTDFSHSELLFPTIVICPAVQYSEDKINKTAYILSETTPNSDTDELSNFLKNLYNMSMDNLEHIHMESERLNIDLAKINTTVRQIVMENALECNHTFKECKFGDHRHRHCCHEFDPIYSQHGLCYGFNSKYKSELMYDIDLKPNNTIKKSEQEFSLIITPATQDELNIFVLWSEEYFDVRFRCLATFSDKNFIKILVQDEETITTEQTKELSITQRKCVFEGEIKLNYFVSYTYLTCIKDCEIKNTIEFCKCVPSFYRIVENVTTSICDFKDFPCLIKYNKNITDIYSCSCEISCNNLFYEIEKIETSSQTEESFKDIRIEFINWPIVRYKREILFGWIDLLVSFGGIGGLFLGFSLLSGAEIIYYFTMRTCCMIIIDKEKLSSMEDKIKNQKIKKLNLSLTIGKSKKVGNNLSENPNSFQNNELLMIQPRVNYLNGNFKPRIIQHRQVKRHIYLP